MPNEITPVFAYTPSTPFQPLAGDRHLEQYLLDPNTFPFVLALSFHYFIFMGHNLIETRT